MPMGRTVFPAARLPGRAWLLLLSAFAFNLLISCATGPGREPYQRNGRTGWPQIEGATYVGEDQCAGCHDARAKTFQHTVHGQASVQREGDELHISCEKCHGPGSKHAEEGGDPRFILKNDSQSCLQCHREKRAQFSLMYRHPVLEGRMQCADCHTLHETGGKAKTSLTTNEKCLSCHEEKRGPWVFEHEALRDGCTACHLPHGSMNNKMLTESDTNLCLKCHFNDETHQSQGHYGHRRAINPVPSSCVKCHTAIHGSNFSKEFRGIGGD